MSCTELICSPAEGISRAQRCTCAKVTIQARLRSVVKRSSGKDRYDQCRDHLLPWSFLTDCEPDHHWRTAPTFPGSIISLATATKGYSGKLLRLLCRLLCSKQSVLMQRSLYSPPSTGTPFIPGSRTTPCCIHLTSPRQYNS